jgi:hypothetical protein
MPATIQREPNNTCVLHINGTLLRSEFGKLQDTTAGDIDAGAQPRILAILEDFNGWEKGADWGDLEFLFSHSHEIAKIAIVGETRWETEALAFAGAGSRRAPVKFFPSEKQAEARAWLAE